MITESCTAGGPQVENIESTTRLSHRQPFDDQSSFIYWLLPRTIYSDLSIEIMDGDAQLRNELTGA